MAELNDEVRRFRAVAETNANATRSELPMNKQQAQARTVPERLEDLGDLFRKRNQDYGSAYKHFGKLLLALFPEGVTLRTEEDFNRFALFFLGVGKYGRYARKFHEGPSTDHCDDISVYAQMLSEYDEECKNANNK